MAAEKPFRADLERLWAIRFSQDKPKSEKFRLYMREPGTRFIALYRFRRFAKRAYDKNKLLGLPLNVLALLLYRHAEHKHNIHFESSDDFGPGLFIAHPACIFIGGSIGKNCFLHQFTTIGWGYADGKYGTPEIGDNVWIGPNVVISGKIKIGSNATIAAGSVVTKDIPENALAMGNPARVISTEYDNNQLFEKR